MSASRHVIESASFVSRSAPASRLDRIAGTSGLAFALIVLLENLILGAISPPPGDASANEITAFFTGNDTALTAVVGMVPFAAVALCVFLGSVFPRLSESSTEASFWTRVGAIGVAIVLILFLTGVAFELVLIANAESLAGEQALTETLWQLRNAALVVNGLGICITLLGLSRAARLSGVIPGWQEALGLVAALAFFIAAVAAVPAVEGSPIGLLGFAAFIVWLVWLAMTSIRLLRASPETT